MIAFNILIGLLVLSNIVILFLIIKSRKQQTLMLGGLFSISQQMIENHTEMKNRVGFNRVCVQYCLICIRPYILTIQRKAESREDYEEANACKKILESINELINVSDNKQPKSTK